MTIHYPHTGHLVELADKNRQNPTDAERRFIEFCEDMGIPYEFQVPIYCDGKGYILDFEISFEYRAKTRMKKIYYVVEIDGGYHNLPEQQKKDMQRTEDLLEGRYKKVIRLKNEQVSGYYDIFNSLYGSIPNSSKGGKALREYIKKQYTQFDASANKWPKNKPQRSFKEEIERINDKAKIAKLEEEIAILKQVNWNLSKQVYDSQLEIKKWQEKVDEVNERIWLLSVSTGNFKYYMDDNVVIH